MENPTRCGKPRANDQSFGPPPEGSEKDHGLGYVWLPETESFDHGLPRQVGDRIIGMTDEPWYCLKSVTGMFVLPARRIKLMARQ